MLEIHRTGSKVLVALMVSAIGCGGSGETNKLTDASPSRDGGGGDDGAQRPTIDSFTATPARLPFGGGVVAVTWTVSNATSVELQGAPVPVAGSSVSVTVDRSVTLELRAHGPGGDAMAITDVVVETTITVAGRVIDERGSPLANVNYFIREDPARLGFSTRDDGTFERAVANVPPPYTICLALPITCYVGLTRTNPTLVLRRTSVGFPPGSGSTVQGTVRRADGAPFIPNEVSMVVDGPGTISGGIQSDVGLVTSGPYDTVLLMAPGVAPPVGSAWAVMLDRITTTTATAAFARTNDFALVPGGTVSGQDLAMAPTTIKTAAAIPSGPFPSTSVDVTWGLAFPRGGLRTLGFGQQVTMPVVPELRMFATAAAVNRTTRERLSTVTDVRDITDGLIELNVPPVPVIVSPPAGSRLTADTDIAWTPLAGAVYRVRIAETDGLRAVTELVLSASSGRYPTNLLFGPLVTADCTRAPCDVSVETYGGLASIDAATDGPALIDVRRGGRSGSYTPGPPTRFSN